MEDLSPADIGAVALSHIAAVKKAASGISREQSHTKCARRLHSARLVLERLARAAEVEQPLLVQPNPVQHLAGNEKVLRTSGLETQL